MEPRNRFRQAGNRFQDSLKGLQIRAKLSLILLAKRIKQEYRLWRTSISNFKGCQQRGLIYTEDKPLGRLCKMCNTFFYEFRVILSVNVTARTCTAILCNSWGETFAAKVPALWTVCTTFPKLARNRSIQWPHTWLTTIYTRSWAALRGWDPPPYDRSSVFSDPW